MEDKKYTQLSLTKLVKKELDRRKMKEQAKQGKPLSWDEYLLQITEANQ